MRFLPHGNGIGRMLLLKSIVMVGLLLFATTPLYATQVTLAWDANSPTPDRYQVFQRIEGASYNFNSPAWSGSAATCTLNNLSYDTTYYFVVRAVSGNLQSTNSNQVTFRRTLPVHRITASAGAGGAITPSGSINVPQGRGQSFSITAQSGYRIANVLVNGNGVGSVSAHTFSAVSSDHSIQASFERIQSGGAPGTTNVVFGSSPDADHPGTVQDTFINLDTSVNASSTLLNTYTWPVNTPANAVLMKFDLSHLPAHAKIQSATLTLYQVQAGGDASYDVSVQKIINHNPDLNAANGFTFDGVNHWTANTACFNNIPMAQADIAATEDVKHLDRLSGYKHWDVTGMVQDWIRDTASNYGLMLNSDTAAGSDSSRFFASSEAADPTVRPVLEVTYTTKGK